jgi:phage gp46-like protein
MPAKANRYLTVSGDYQQLAGGVRGDDGFTSKVILALRTRLGSCIAFPEFGSRLHEIKIADERGRKMAEKRAAQALVHLAEQYDGLVVQAVLENKTIVVYVSGKRGSTELRAQYTATAGGG